VSQTYSVKLTQIIEELNLEILHEGEGFEETQVITGDVMRPGLPLAGFYDYFDDDRLQVIGRMERAYMDDFSPAQRMRSFDMLLSHRIPRRHYHARDGPSARTAQQRETK
jgi:HPr kinase/phosphorylase